MLTALAAPVLGLVARRAHGRMGAAPERLLERFGGGGEAGPVLWIVAASLGELRAASAVVSRLPQDMAVLVTTTTQSAAEMARRILPPRVRHRFQPLDTPGAVTRFLSAWKPFGLVLMESELPLRAITRMQAMGRPVGILNARPSRTRDRFATSLRPVLKCLRLASAQDGETKAALLALGVPNEVLAGAVDLKAFAPSPPADPAEVKALRAGLGAEPVTLVLSAHPEEAETFAALAGAIPGALVIAPRHPKTAERFVAALTARGHGVRRRSKGEAPAAGSVYIADTLGDVGTLLAVADLVVLGGTFAEIGGHSPREALAAGIGVVHGPCPGVAETALAEAVAAGAALRVTEPAALAQRVADLLTSGDALRMAEAAGAFTTPGAEIVDKIAAELATWGTAP
jgi:3-deoxy-D-manno-octulosonic-acid transferase